LKRRSCDISDLERVPSEKVAGFTGSLERTLVVVAGTDSPFWSALMMLAFEEPYATFSWAKK